jgi:phage shock protein A
MGILDRLSTLVRSNLNAAIDKMSDPGKEIDLLVLELERELKDARVQLRDAMAQEKLGRKKVESFVAEEKEWQTRAEQAVRAGDDTLAKAALERQAHIGQDRTSAEEMLRQQGEFVVQLGAALRQLEAKVDQVKARKETLKAQVRAKKDGGIGAKATAKYEDFITGVEVKEAEQALDEELKKARHEDSASLETEAKLHALDKDKDLDDRLAALKAKMDKK